jgi:hypothetical protein
MRFAALLLSEQRSRGRWARSERLLGKINVAKAPPRIHQRDLLR